MFLQLNQINKNKNYDDGIVSKNNSMTFVTFWLNMYLLIYNKCHLKLKHYPQDDYNLT